MQGKRSVSGGLASRGAGWLVALVLGALGAFAQESGDDEAGAAGRQALAALVQRCLDGRSPQPAALEPREREYGLAFTAVAEKGLRVLATGGEAEARRVAISMGAARELFAELTGLTAYFPSGLTAYLLGTPEAKATFLQKHPKLGPAASERMGKLEGSGVPGTADWAWWQGDAEKRNDGMVRFTLDWLLRAHGVTTESHAWLHEGLGLYLTDALVGTHLTWFVQPSKGPAAVALDNKALRDRMDDYGADWLALAREVFAPDRRFDLEELLHLLPNEMEPADYLRVTALAAYLVEVRREVLGPLLTRVGAGEDPRLVLEESLGFPFGELRARLATWLERREVLVARAAGRRPVGELEAEWRKMGTLQKRATIAAFERRVAELDTAQLRWLRAVLARVPSEIPKAEAPPYYDPKVHAPAQPIPRKRLSPSDRRVKRLLEEVRGNDDPRSASLSVDYDWLRGRVARLERPDPESVFQNALRGIPPDGDLVRAQLLAIFDRAEERKLQAAFAHAYTDREGNAFPVSLFEMWATGATMEMPDVDTLGIIHEVDDEWSRWVAPVTEQESLYKRIGELFQRAQRSRELRVQLAELFLFPSSPPRPGYETQLLNLQALWASLDSDPVRVAASLPGGNGRDAFLAELVTRCQRDYPLFASGRRRAAQLRLDAEELRKALGAALDEVVQAGEAGSEEAGPSGQPGEAAASPPGETDGG